MAATRKFALKKGRAGKTAIAKPVVPLRADRVEGRALVSSAQGAKPPGRGRAAHAKASAGREPLTRERIIDAALALIDRDGLQAFSARKLGDALGVEAMSVYHHFASKQHLLDALVDHAIDSVKLPPPGANAIERLWRACFAYRDMARRFPRLYPLIALHRLNTPTGVRFIERYLELIAAVEPDVEQRARSFRAIGYYLTGAALDETSGYAQGPSAAEPVDDAFIGAHCPQLIQAAPYFKQQHWDRTFEAGLAALFVGFRAC